jgi:hypothetical protein
VAAVKSSKSEDYPIDIIDDRIIGLMLQRPSITKSEIAKEVGLNYETVRRRMFREEFTARFREALQPLWDVMTDTARIAAIKLRELINHEDPNISLKAIELTLKPFFANAQNQEKSNVKEIVYKAEFNSSGDVQTSKVLIEGPSDTLELLNYNAYEDTTATETTQ